MSRICWDTNLFIYLFEDEGERSDQVVSILHRMLERGDQLVTSTLFVAEILVKPLKNVETSLAVEYENVIQTRAHVVSFDMTEDRRFAEIRCDRTITPPDAVQLACAAVAGSDLFFTNDERLSQKVISFIEFIQSLSNVHV